MNNPTLGEFCFTIMGRVDIEGWKSNVTSSFQRYGVLSFRKTHKNPPFSPPHVFCVSQSAIRTRLAVWRFCFTILATLIAFSDHRVCRPSRAFLPPTSFRFIVRCQTELAFVWKVAHVSVAAVARGCVSLEKYLSKSFYPFRSLRDSMRCGV